MPTTHGYTGSKTYGVWKNMMQRCNNPNNPQYKNYGARGIRVCKRWRSFEHFLTDMGEAPAGLSIDRINNDLGYEPENCKWSTLREQLNNRRKTIFVTFRNETLPLAVLAERHGKQRQMFGNRLKAGWSVAEALDEEAGRIKYRADLALAIQEAYQAGGVSQRQLAARFNVGLTRVSHILTGRPYRKPRAPTEN